MLRKTLSRAAIGVGVFAVAFLMGRAEAYAAKTG
jgi:hypothetical protein